MTQTSLPDKMFADEILRGLNTRFIGHKIFSYESLDSTNDTAFALGEKGLKEGVCVFAEYQKKGRGRLGRSWVSPKWKNLILSILLRPMLSPHEVSKITLVTAVSVVKTIKHVTGKTLGIKWPNDIYFQREKVGGILTEMSAEADRVRFVVVGIGINLNAAKNELPPQSTSLKIILQKEISRLHFAQELLRQMESDVLRLKNGQFETMAKEWEEFSITTGQRVTASILGRKVQGQAMGIDAEGALWIRKDNGLQERIMAGDVEHENLSR